VPETRPFLLSPSVAERVWGGTRFGPGIGEAWDLSVHPNGLSTVASGPQRGVTLADVVDAHPEHFGGPIDLLAKRLDCATNLSVQVHPRTGDPKTEAWVVLDAEPGAGVYLGFRDRPSVDDVRAAALDGTLDELLHFVDLREGDAVFVPAGTVHAIGGGLVLFELQQSSDTTFRLFDWGRTDRALHLDEGLACADLTPPPPLPEPVVEAPGVTRLVECEHFRIDRLATSVPVAVDPAGRWTALLGVRGSGRVADLTVTAGDTVVVPASAGRVDLEPSGAFVGLRYGPPSAG
jgi:mannose-6-phosphate isomerase